MKLTFQVSLLNEMACFGMGECTEGRLIVSKTPITVLRIERHWLSSKFSANTWILLEKIINKSIPSRSTVFKLFEQERKWQAYKRTLVKDMIKGKLPCNSLNNIPYSIRMTDWVDCGVQY